MAKKNTAQVVPAVDDIALPLEEVVSPDRLHPETTGDSTPSNPVLERVSPDRINPHDCNIVIL